MKMKTTTKERPIIFGGAMVQEILGGRKTQARRKCNPAEQAGLTFVAEVDADGMIPQTNANITAWGDEEGRLLFTCPDGMVGGLLWVKETWAEHDGITVYKASTPPHQHGLNWKSPLFMPRSASRILLEIESVRVERLWSISSADCVAEGCRGGHGSIPGYGYSALPKEQYFWVWDQTNGKHASKSNPWVWVIGFKRVGGAA